MYSLPNPLNKVVKKNAHKDLTPKKSEGIKKPNIIQIKHQIESILNRNSNPFYPLSSVSPKKSHKLLANHSLQRSQSKILYINHKQAFQKVLNHRKTYEQFLLADLASKKHFRTIDDLKQTQKIKQTSSFLYARQSLIKRQTSKSNFAAYKVEKGGETFMFTDKQYQRLGLGKLFFYKNSKVKLRRKDLISGNRSLQAKNTLKQICIEPFHKQPSLDLTKYMRSTSIASIHEQTLKPQQNEPNLTTKRSLQTFKKQIIPKQVLSEDNTMTLNLEQLKIGGYAKEYRTSTERLRQKIRKYDISPHFIDHSNDVQTHQTLNVLDEELLVYYGKMKSKKIQNVLLKNPKTYYRPRSKNTQYIEKKYAERNSQLQIQNDLKTSIDFRLPKRFDHQWKFQQIDPWQKMKHDYETGHENQFPRLSSKMGSDSEQMLSFQYKKGL